MFFPTDWLVDSDRGGDFEQMEPPEFAALLCHFYAALGPKSAGSTYSKASYTGIRAAIHRHMISPPFSRQMNILKDREFSKANQVFIGILKTLRSEGKDITKHHQAIEPDELKIIYENVLNDQSPWALLNKVFFEISLFCARRGMEGLRDLNKHSFVFKTDTNGTEYVTMACNEKEKTKQGSERNIKEKEAIMYAQPGSDKCPVTSLKKYLGLLHPDCPAFFQYPCKNWNKGPIWYNNMPVGKNTLSKMMKTISKNAGLETEYTNHCIRATSITALHRAGTDAQSITYVSGHKNVTGLEPYTAGPSHKKKQDMSNTLFNFANGTPSSEESIAPNFYTCY